MITLDFKKKKYEQNNHGSLLRLSVYYTMGEYTQRRLLN